MFEKRLALIEKMEKNLPIQKWTINGIHIWPLIRISLIVSDNFHDLVKSNYPRSKKSPMNNFSRILLLITNIFSEYRKKLTDFRHNQFFIRESNPIFLGTSKLRQFKLNGTYYAPIIDTFMNLMKILNKDPLFLEYEIDYEYRVPRYSKSRLIQSKLDIRKFFAKIKQLFLKNRLNINLPKFDRYLEFLNKHNLLTQYTSINEIIYQFLVMSSRKNYFKRILKKTKCSVGFVVCYYVPESFAFIWACKELNIPTVDIQHGIEGANISYSKWKDIPDEGYEILPDYFWVWSEYEAKIINSWSDGIQSHKSFIGGDLWLQLWKENNNQLVKVYNDSLLSFIPTYSQVIILVSLQPGFSYDWLLETIKLCPKEWFWLIRLHPRMHSERKKFHHLFSQNLDTSIYNIDQATDLPLHYLLAHTDFHVTLHSAVVIEASQFGIPSIVAHTDYKTLFPVEYEQGYIKHSKKPSQIMNHIKNLSLSKDRERNKPFSENKLPSIDIIQKFFKQISDPSG